MDAFSKLLYGDKRLFLFSDFLLSMRLTSRACEFEHEGGISCLFFI